MKATEIRDKLDELIEEFGDSEGFLVDELEPKWRNPVTDVEFERDSQAVVFVSDR